MSRSYHEFTSSFEVILYSDVDGTIIPKSNQLSPNVREYLEVFTQAGFGFTLATGRSFLAVRRILKQIRVNAPVVLCNGAFVYDTHTERTWWTAIPKSVIVQLFHKLGRIGDICMYFECNDHTLFVSDQKAVLDPFLLEEGIRATYFQSLRDVQNDQEIVKFGIKILSTERSKFEEVLQQILLVLNEYKHVVQYCFSSDAYLEVIPLGVSKWSGIQISQSMIHKRSKSIYTIGDHYNDLEMIQQADVGIAMGNAVDAVKQVADFVTGSVEEDAMTEVVSFIMKQNRKVNVQ